MLARLGKAVIASTALLIALGSAVPTAYAQDVAAPIALPAVSQDDVLAACTAEGATEANCKAVIAAYFAYLQSTGQDIQAAVATLVVALAEADVAVPGIKEVVVAAITEIANTYADPTTQAAILEIAQTIEDGGVPDTGAIGISPA